MASPSLDWQRPQRPCSRSSRIQCTTSAELAFGATARKASISCAACFRRFLSTHLRSASLIARRNFMVLNCQRRG